MHILILAAGFGTRLKAYGENLPKGLIEVEGTTLVGRVISELQTLESKNTALVTNARFFEVYSQWLATTHPTLEIKILDNGIADPDHRKGALGDIIFAVDQLSWWEEDLLVLPSDTYYHFSLSEFVEFALEYQGFSTVVRQMSKEQIAGRLGCAVVENNKITAFVEKPEVPPSDYAAIPFYFYPKEVLAKLPEYQEAGRNMDAPGNVIPWLLENNIPVYAFVTQEQTLDVGTAEDVKHLQSL